MIRGKDGRGEPIEVLKINPETRENVLDYVINGFVVGSTCLLKYGHLDINKIMSGDFTGAVTEPAVIEPALEAVVVEEAVVIVEKRPPKLAKLLKKLAKTTKTMMTKTTVKMPKKTPRTNNV